MEIINDYPIFQSISKFNLVLIELHNENIHGINNTNNYIDSHYLLIDSFYPYNYYSKNDINNLNNIENENEIELYNINDTIEAYRNYYRTLFRQFCKHKFIRNYYKIIKYYIKPQIGLIIELPSHERIVIIKTFWIKIIQRTWKNIYKKRILIINKRKHIHNINYKILNGVWSRGLNNIPSLKGMLYYLVK